MIPLLFEPAYVFHAGAKPLLISMPHVGTRMPDDHRRLLNESAKDLPDTDWHLDRIYDFAKEIGASILQAQYSRILIDLNRPADDAPLYAGATTGLFPTTLFDGRPIYRSEPDAKWRETYRQHLWQTYHERLKRELDWMRKEFGYAILFDAHSIKSHIPRLFEGQLPHFNIGTNDGKSCDSLLAQDVAELLSDTSDYSCVLDGRFKGGFITRHYGQPQNNIHALQLELAQRSYMQEEAPYTYDEEKAARLKPLLRKVLERLVKGVI